MTSDKSSQVDSEQLRHAVLYRVVQSRQGFGKIQIQKIMYFLQTAFEVPLRYSFRMHHYGPYSEDLETDLTILKLTGYINIEPDLEGYGFHVMTRDNPENNWVGQAQLFKDQINEALILFANKPAYELELAATIHFVNRLENRPSPKVLINLISHLKPKFTEEFIEGKYDELKTTGLLD